MSNVKQVILMRTDTEPPMRKGKMIAQGSHASIAFLTRRIEAAAKRKTVTDILSELTAEQKEWMFNGSFAKICLRVDSLHELQEIADKARKAGLEVHVVTDSGKTEFKEPTVTCLAIGPDKAEKIDPITGHLKLL